MYLKKKLKRIGALFLAIMMMLSGMSFAYAEEQQVIQETPDEPLMESDNEISLVDSDESLSVDLEEDLPIEIEMSEDISSEQKTVEDEMPSDTDEDESSDPEPIQEDETIDIPSESDEAELAETEPAEPEHDEEEPIEDQTETEPKVNPVNKLHNAIDQNGYAYAQSHNNISVYSDKSLKEIIYHADSNRNIWLVTAYTENNEVTVYGMDSNGSVISGHVKETALEDMPLSEGDVSRLAEDHPCDTKSTDIGPMLLFVISGDWNEEKKQEEPVLIEEPIPQEEEPELIPDESSSAETVTDPSAPENEEFEFIEEEISDTEDIEAPAEDEIFSEEPDTAESAEESVEESSDESVEETEFLEEETFLEEEPVDEPVVPEAQTRQIGDYVLVTTSTRVFSDVDITALSDGFPRLLEGCFVKNAVVKISSIETDEDGHTWYQVTYQYGDSFTNGKPKWTATDSVYVIAEETFLTGEDALTTTDYAYTKEQMQLRKGGSGRKLMAATPTDGFTLKNISVSLGSFSVGQSGLSGSSGKDSDYPQLAKSAAHGTIYATPHYLSGYTVFCLEHTYSGPGEGSGSNKTPTGPYTLLDMNAYCNTAAGNGVSGYRFKESTMHAVAWVLRHTYPFMVLNRSDSNNNTWSRAAGQFAIREVIKQLEGSQYVRDYWNMSDFYSFSGGAPSVYLTYAKWLATNGIAHAGITGNITVSNKSVSISGSNYVGKVTLKTDADLIRIPRSVGTLTGNSGSSDSNYYYAKSGDTISITSAQNTFIVPMESISAADEEAGFLVGVPGASIQKVLVPVSFGPYPLKSQSVNFELTYGSITVTKKASDGTLLKGAVIELLNGTSVIATATTDSTGKASFNSVTPGTYTIREKTAPQGFQLGNATTQSVTVAAGVTTTATFTNQPIAKKIRINKTDSVTGKGLPGATFTITRLSGPDSFSASNIGKVVATITTNGNGIAETDLLPYGEYRITETVVPDGYLDNGYTTTQWIK